MANPLLVHLATQILTSQCRRNGDFLVTDWMYGLRAWCPRAGAVLLLTVISNRSYD